MKKSKGVTFLFFTSENIIFLIFIIFSGIGIISSCYYIENENLKNVAITLASSIFVAVLIPFCLNLGNIIYERRKVRGLCLSIIDVAVVLVADLNTHIVKSGGKPCEDCYGLKQMLKNGKISLENYDTTRELFLLISKKLEHIVELKYLNYSHSFEILSVRATSQMNKAVEVNDFSSLYLELAKVLGLLSIIKVPFYKHNYMVQFNNKIKQMNANILNKYYMYTDDYIVSRLENDLAEKMYTKN